ncbi:asparaginase [Lentilitoribacter sp. Alg239-R112]|uniref:asparaginase n=1 Tax=Lentilitoribacter sp. Alg239-R112 TaxID=2305987 RepID=UPI0013A6E7F0|nr:asparaginase [Lentilitoribacter sp. Alg239-R112]
MINPTLVELTRGRSVESKHCGAYAVSDGSGKIVMSAGNIESPIFPRSAVKAMQALLLVESGAASTYGFGNRELALACASHSGEQKHAELAAQMLAKAGLDQTNMECGTHWSFHPNILIEQAKFGVEPSCLHNNCSGKHAGFLCVACHCNLPLRGYVNSQHTVQQEVARSLEAMTGSKLDMDLCGIDGCAIPTYAVPLKKLAHGFAKMATGEGLTSERAKASKTLIDACMAEPFYVAGTDRACTKLMEIAPGEIFVKTGAEGVYTAALPKLGLGMALKIDDGATRAAEVVIAELIANYMEAEEPIAANLKAFANRELTNWNGDIVGKITASLQS